MYSPSLASNLSSSDLFKGGTPGFDYTGGLVGNVPYDAGGILTGDIDYSGAFGGGGGGSLDKVLSGVVNIAGGLGELFGEGSKGSSINDYIDLVEKATRELDRRAAIAEEKFDTRLGEEIYPGLTGSTVPQKMGDYYRQFADAAKGFYDRGLQQLSIDPNLGATYDRLADRVDQIQNQYSLANKLGGYEKIALDPSVVQIDTGRLTMAGDRFMDPKYKQTYDYGDPQASRFIYGSRNTAEDIGKYYNTSGDVSGLMNYGGIV